MKYRLAVLFGQEQVRKMFQWETLTEEEQMQFVKIYEFSSEKEKIAFIRGMEAVSGWQDYYIFEENIQIFDYDIDSHILLV